MDKIELSGTVEKAFRRNGRTYFTVSVSSPTNRDLNAREEFKIPVTGETYEKYRQQIKDSQHRESEHYISISGDLEIKVEEYIPF